MGQLSLPDWPTDVRLLEMNSFLGRPKQNISTGTHSTGRMKRRIREQEKTIAFRKLD